jgi:predicted ribosome quality control (RQC) complex YloA/Tae2 family protein
MTSAQPPWADLSVLQNLTAHLRGIWIGRDVFRMAIGPDWMRLHLVGDERPGLVISSRPGSNFVFAMEGTWAEPMKQALPLVKGSHPLGPLLTGTALTGIGTLPADRVLALRLRTTDGKTLYLLHQLFGARGNTTLIDHHGKMIWARHPGPHNLLTSVPPRGTWSTGQAENPEGWADDLFGQMLGLFQKRLVHDVFTSHQTAISRSSNTTNRLVTNLSRDLENANRGDEYRRTAEALAANLHTLKRGQESAEIFDLQDGSPLMVSLNPAVTPAANMEQWFRKARKAEKGRQIIADNLARSEDLQSSQQLALAQLDLINELTDDHEKLSALHQWAADNAALLPAARIAKKQRTKSAEEPARLFRRYLINDKWEVWVGRNNKENDLLTHRASHTQDIWLHAQGVSGSHVILRTSGHPELVPKTVLEKAAGLAALHSKARHSSLVPVIYTERRYVRKPRKAPVGTAVCLREKNLFTEPGIAPGVISI